MNEQQLSWLKAFQQKLDGGAAHLGKSGDLKMIPLAVHIVGTSAGTGYYKVRNVLEQICILNHNYEPLGFHFYLKNIPDYVNDDGLFIGNSDDIWSKAADYKDQSAANVFFPAVFGAVCILAE